jgi:hypothetical protein
MNLIVNFAREIMKPAELRSLLNLAPGNGSYGRKYTV